MTDRPENCRTCSLTLKLSYYWDMVDSISDLLSRKDFDEPPEMAAIKSFIKETFDEEAEVMVRERDIVITVRSSSLANALRLKTNELRKQADTQKRLIFRIR